MSRTSTAMQEKKKAQAPCRMLLSKVQKALCNYEQCRSGAAVIAVLLSITELKSKSFWPVGFITIFGHLRAPFVAYYVGDWLREAAGVGASS